MKDYHCIYSYTPSLDKVKSGIAVSGCFIGAICMMAVAENEFILSHLFRFMAAVSVVVGAMLACRLFACGYVYSIYRDTETGLFDLVILEIKGNKTRKVCKISLYDILEFSEYDLSEKKKGKRPEKPKPDRKKYKDYKVYNYCKDIIPSRYCLIRVCEECDKFIKFSPDKTMIEIIKSAEF